MVSSGAFSGFSVSTSNIGSWQIKGAGRTALSINGGHGVSDAGATVSTQDLPVSGFHERETTGPEDGVVEVLRCNIFLGGPLSVGISATGEQISVYGNVRFSRSGRACMLPNSLARLGCADGVTTRTLAMDWAAGANLVAADTGGIYGFPSNSFQDACPTGGQHLNGITNMQGAGALLFSGATAGAEEPGRNYV